MLNTVLNQGWEPGGWGGGNRAGKREEGRKEAETKAAFCTLRQFLLYKKMSFFGRLFVLAWTGMEERGFSCSW